MEEDLGEVRIEQVGQIEWVAMFCYDKGMGEIQILRKSFLSLHPGNVMYLIAQAVGQLETYHFEGDINGGVSPDLARRLSSRISEIQGGDG